MLTVGQRSFRVFLRNRIAVAGMLLVVAFLLVAVFADVLAPHDVREQDVRGRYAGASATHWFGTDELGRDVLSRILVGSRISLFVGIGSVAVAMVIGLWLGVLAGYRGGKVDRAVTWTVDTLMAFPTLLMGLLIVSALGPGLRNTLIAITLTFIPRFARLARGQTVVLREFDFVLAERALGAAQTRIILRHILPNLVGEIVVMGSLWISTAIVIESSLSFLGLGVQPPAPSWGVMIKSGVDEMLMAPFLAVYPGLAISLAVLAFNLAGDGMRDLLDPKLLR